MSTLEERLRACAARSEDAQVAWELYQDWRHGHVDVVPAAGPALPLALLEARADADIALAPCDLGVFHDPLYGCGEGEVTSVPPCGSPDDDTVHAPPSALLLQGPEVADVALAHPYGGRCRAHEDCLDYGVMLGYRDRSYLWHECEGGSVDASTLPGPLKRCDGHFPEELAKLVRAAGTIGPASGNDVAGAGSTAILPLYCGSRVLRVGDVDAARTERVPRLIDRVRRVWPWAGKPRTVFEQGVGADSEYWTASEGRESPTLGVPVDPDPGGIGEAGPGDVLERGVWVMDGVRDRCSSGQQARMPEVGRLFTDDGYFGGTVRQLHAFQQRRCAHGSRYWDGSCCSDPDLSD